MRLILDNTKEVRDFLNDKGIKEVYHSNVKMIADRIVVTGKCFRQISRSGFPFTENAVDYTGNFNDAKILLNSLL